MYALRQRQAQPAAPRRAVAAVERGERFTLHPAPGVALVATRFAAAQPRDAIVIAPATGVPQGLYRAFAAWAARQGTTAYTFDYRGVAASRPVRLRGFDAGFAQWADDIDAALSHALPHHERVSLVGHSIGGFLAPVAEHATRLHRLVLVGAQTAYWRDWPLRQRAPMALLWHGLMPAVTAAVGYFPGRALRLGEDLPRGVAMQWASRPWRDPFGPAHGALPRARYARAMPPVHLVAASDDPFATAAAMDRVEHALRATPVQRHTWQPRELGLARLGHFDAFRAQGAPLWPQLLGWALTTER